MLEKYSDKQLENIRQIVDEMLGSYGRLVGGMEALRLLYREFGNRQDMSMLYNQIMGMQVFGNRIQTVLFSFADELAKEIENRKNGNKQ